MLKSVFLSLLAAVLLPGVPSVSWKAEVKPESGKQYQLVITGTVAPDYYVHPMSDHL